MKTRNIIITIAIAALVLFVMASLIKDIPELIKFNEADKIIHAPSQFILALGID